MYCHFTELSKEATYNVESEPMQIGHARLSPKERQHCINAKDIYCGKKEHFIAACQVWLNRLSHQ